MKQFFFYFLLSGISTFAVAQPDFTGIAKYKISSVGADDTNADSMAIIFDKFRMKVILYIPDSRNSSHVSEKIFIDDLKAKKSFTVDPATKTYTVDSLRNNSSYNFINTNKFTGSNGFICFSYLADSTKLDRSLTSKIECLGSIDFLTSSVEKYFFYGIQPVIIDNRIIMDFITTRADGTRPRTYVSDITRIEDTRSYFNLEGYRLVK